MNLLSVYVSRHALEKKADSLSDQYRLLFYLYCGAVLPPYNTDHHDPLLAVMEGTSMTAVFEKGEAAVKVLN